MSAAHAVVPIFRAGEAVSLIADIAGAVWAHWPVSSRLGRYAEGALHRSQTVPIAVDEHVSRPNRFTYERRIGRRRRPRALPPELRAHVAREIASCVERLDARAAAESDPHRRDQIDKLAGITHNLGRWIETEPDQC